ncbi:MAG: ECF transporter S component [Solirubrobacteraceae bacterium]|nr:ECF transporter S component [Solirubrobacteraceae bacterium]
MSDWALPAFVVVVVAVAGGLRWYERSRPTSRTLALVATLAALATIARVAFAPIPNVKPTTDIVLLAGFALGPAPGFAVGAFAGLTSNFIFGHGPWTPWQMAAWGVCGLLGAGLAAATRGRAGRWAIALTCAAAGLLFGLIMTLSTWLTFTAGPAEDTLPLILLSALPFDIAHAVGNLVFALAFGPAVVVAVRRAARRREGRFVEAGALDGRAPDARPLDVPATTAG